MLTVRLFYGIINHQKILSEAFEDARKLDEETSTFQLYK